MSLISSPNNSTLPDSTLPESNSNMSTTIPLDPIVILNIPISTKLNRSNFLAWKSEITPVLHGHGLYRYLTEDPPSEQLTVDGSQHTNPRFSHWHWQDQHILSWMRSSISDNILGQVASCTSAAELWKSLQQSFSATSWPCLSELRSSLQTMTKEGLSCSDYCQKMRSIADELAFIGHPVTDDELVLQVLCGLGSDFNSFVIAATMKDHLSFDEFQAMLQTHENLLQAQSGGNSSSLPSSQNPVALYATSKSGLSSYNSKPGRGGFRPKGNYQSPSSAKQSFIKPN